MNTKTAEDRQLTANTIAGLIYGGQLDEHLVRLTASIHNRRQSLANDKRDEMKIGDIVYFNKKVKPKFLAGQAVRVVKFNTKKIVVDLVNPIGRWKDSVSTPLSLIALTLAEVDA